MAAMESYQCHPLTESDGIRPFEIRPAIPRIAMAEGYLVHTTLTECCDEVVDHFTALSYVWGDAPDTTTILVDGKPLSVTKTLDLALRHLREPKMVIRVWADAICISQSDNIERNVQVQQMGSVYQTAHHTVIFLGESR
jgi:hypothetical protein